MDTIHLQCSKIDWDKFFSLVSSMSLFKNEKIQISYFENWKSLFKKYDAYSFVLPNACIQNYPIPFSLKIYNNPPVHFDAAIHIPNLIKSLAQENEPPIRLQSKLLGTAIDYSVDVHYTSASSEPLIIVKDSFNERLILIDGNHRAKYIKNHNLEFFHAYILKPHFFIDNPRLFIRAFDYCLFHFWFDLQFFLRLQPSQTFFSTLFSFYEKTSVKKYSCYPHVKAALDSLLD
ncbi:hypothetical protein A5819_003684 [Enterococcus sp. 7E2_DIV0204]|uniref:hypothetical protein n=1 Tax=unclassified Enterococcus TaxID=2608891 RepID=UPI000A3418BC|nr:MULTISPECIES: hypothetical protein [unclassified Enterococcus]OTN83865.1 hypothetical protein A5819_003684 [Enterococcus sp. 7E2_DIV0204]OTP47571.1 hypothetical protein A5884_003542 [Enterococcus sp. 7D2_DIV0200]